VLPSRLAANDDMIWNNVVFGRRVHELGVVGAASLLRSLLKYLENIVVALEDEMLDDASLDLIRNDLTPISGFLGFVGLSTLLLQKDMSTKASRQRLRMSVTGVIGECRKYCDKFS